jgi:methyltransferase (TIGR00027 family)
MTGETRSLTAQRAAMRSTVHQMIDHPRVFEDPLAIAIIGEEALANLKAGPERLERTGSQHLRAFVAARNRFAEDELAAAIGRGATQYVILGAGLDTYAYRNLNAGVRVFEVDHPATQAWKRNRLEAAGIAIPTSLTFVSTDSEEQALGSVLKRSGFEAGEVTFFSWFGGGPYLSAEAATATLAFIGSMPAGSGAVMDYAIQRSFLDSGDQMAMDALASRVGREGEPDLLFVDPRALDRLLRAAGFHYVEDLGPSEIDERYFRGRVDGLQVAPGPAHLVTARV